MPDVFSVPKRRQIMQAVRRENTAPEQELARLLRRVGHRFKCNDTSLPGKPDFHFVTERLLVFVHGCFWHGHDRCRKGRCRPKTRRAYWREKIATNKKRDCRVARKLRRLGYSVYTVWECEIRLRGIPSRLLKALRPQSDTAGSVEH